MSNNQLTIGLVVVAIVAITALFFPQVPSKFGQILDTFTGDYFNVTTANGGGAFRINGSTVLSSSVFTLPTAGGVATLTTSNTATSSLVVGCIQFYATSTATAGHLEFNTQSTTTINGASAGSVAWKYGACPI